MVHRGRAGAALAAVGVLAVGAGQPAGAAPPAAEPKVVRSYDTDHSLDVPAALADREAFLTRTLGL